ncbi:hypothetical protein [Kitasatospora cineracea]|nr:hypothetical protein [Kitasatospora cineracea]
MDARVDLAHRRLVAAAREAIIEEGPAAGQLCGLAALRPRPARALRRAP